MWLQQVTARFQDAPFAEGWLMVIQPKTLRNNLKNLFVDSEGLTSIEDEASRLGGFCLELPDIQ